MTRVDSAMPSGLSGSRFFLWSFVGAIGVGLVVLILIRLLPVSASMVDDPQRRWAMALLPSSEIVSIKLAYAAQNPRYDIGLFGNSRILMVGADDLDLVGRRIFNFAIGGESIRQSIRLLEQLRSQDKAPALAVISMDYAELGLPGGLGVSPGPPWRWLDELRDIWIAWKIEGLRSAAVQAINAADLEWRQMAITFNHVFVLSKLGALAGSAAPPKGLLADGSLKEAVPADAGMVPSFSLSPRSDTYPQLESDFARLAAVRDAGTRVLVYESPVTPQLMSVDDAKLSVKARDVRHRFQAACAKYQLECYGPPLLTGRDWFDRDHAPAALLAAWLRSLIEKKN